MTLLGKLLVGQSSTAALSAFCLHVGRQLVRLAEKATASLMLGPLALVVSQVFRVAVSPLDPSCCSAMQEPVNIEDISWTAMLAKGEREATEDEIAVLEAECGPFQPSDGEG